MASQDSSQQGQWLAQSLASQDCLAKAMTSQKSS